MAEIVERGYDDASMARIAARAGASKETLYAWFGDKPGLVAAVIESNAEVTMPPCDPATVTDRTSAAEVRAALVAVATGLLDLLTSPESIALNRAAMNSPVLAVVLRAAGRERTGEAMQRYLTRLDEQGLINAPDPGAAFSLFVGLVVRDTQIQVLLGGQRPGKKARRAQADQGVELFLTLVGT